MSPAAKRGPPTSGLSGRNWRSTPASHRPADEAPSSVLIPVSFCTDTQGVPSVATLRPPVFVLHLEGADPALRPCASVHVPHHRSRVSGKRRGGAASHAGRQIPAAAR